MAQNQPPGRMDVGILAYHGAQQAAVSGLFDLLTWADRLHEKRTGKSMLQVSTIDTPLKQPANPFTVIVIPPSLREAPPSDPEAGAWLVQQHDEGSVVCSVCVGAFVLAEAGLLDGRRATTHWGLAEAFHRSFPEVHIQSEHLIVDDGDIITAGGLMAWVDLGMHLIHRYLGPTTVLETSRFFIVDPGGREQRFYSTFSPVLTHGDNAILKLQRWLQKNFHDQLTVPLLASQAGMSERTLTRRFQKATGTKITVYIQHLRVTHSRHLLETTQKSQEEVAWAVGYEDPGAFRKVFINLMGLSPREYRRRFTTRV